MLSSVDLLLVNLPYGDFEVVCGYGVTNLNSDFIAMNRPSDGIRRLVAFRDIDTYICGNISFNFNICQGVGICAGKRRCNTSS